MIDCYSMKSSSMFVYIYKVKQKETEPPSQPDFTSKPIGYLVEPRAVGSQATQVQAKQPQLTTSGLTQGWLELNA